MNYEKHQQPLWLSCLESIYNKLLSSVKFINCFKKTGRLACDRFRSKLKIGTVEWRQRRNKASRCWVLKVVFILLRRKNSAALNHLFIKSTTLVPGATPFTCQLRSLSKSKKQSTRLVLQPLFGWKHRREIAESGEFSDFGILRKKRYQGKGLKSSQKLQ